jgi:hypothetical protein|tara:strand:- start:6860 stop:7105 length:246 start_codon:yes stop_codon:yes gene_type:complete
MEKQRVVEKYKIPVSKNELVTYDSFGPLKERYIFDAAAQILSGLVSNSSNYYHEEFGTNLIKESVNMAEELFDVVSKNGEK